MTLVVLQVVGQQRLVAEEHVVDEREARQRIAVVFLAVESLDVVLASGEVPQEVAPVHVAALVAEEEADIVEERGHGNLLAVGVAVGVLGLDRAPCDASVPRLVETGM